MIEIDLAIDYTDLMEGEKEKEESTKKKRLDHIKTIIENGILSSFGGGETAIKGVTQRKVDRILDAIEASEDGKITMPDKRMVLFQEMWTGRMTPPVGGPRRKLIQRIDRIICPDAYKKDDDDEGNKSGTDDKA